MTWRHRSTSSFRPDRSVLSATLKPWTSSNLHYALERRRTSDRQSSPRQHGKQSHHQHHHLSHFHLHLSFLSSSTLSFWSSFLSASSPSYPASSSSHRHLCRHRRCYRIAFIDTIIFVTIIIHIRLMIITIVVVIFLSLSSSF